MLPIPTHRAKAMFFGCVGMLLIGLSTGSWPATALGTSSLLTLGAVLAATLPVGRRVRAQKLEFAWWLSPSTALMSGAVVPHAPFQVRCYVRHRGTDPIVLRRVKPLVPYGAALSENPRGEVAVQALTRTEFTFTMVAQAVGRVVLRGLSVNLRGPLGLFEVPLYFPNALVIKVLPRVAVVRDAFTANVAGLPLDRPGRHRLRRRGGGTELHELREFQQGDPFKAIAWKASARRGQLLVREVDQEVQQTLMLVVDVSGSLRGGPLGARKLDAAIDAAATLAHAWLARGDRVGLMTLDGRILTRVAPGEGRAHLMRIYDALLAGTEIVDADLTTLDDGEVADVVARYVRHQDGVEFMDPQTRRTDVLALVNHVRSALSKKSTDVPQALSPVGSDLRRYCRERGIALPHRATPLGGDKSGSFGAALRLSGGATRVPMTITVISDLDGLLDYEPLSRAARLIARRGHTLSLLVPQARDDGDTAADPLLGDIAHLYEHRDRRHLREARSNLGRFGVQVSPIVHSQHAGKRPPHGPAPSTRVA